MNKMIECKNVVFKYSTGEEIEKLAIDGLNLEVNEGEFLVVLGHNGSGKSTVAKHMNALLVPTEGTVIVNGLDTSDENNVWDIRATAGMVFQNPDNQLVATIVEEDVAFGPENLGVPPEEIRKRVYDALEKVGMSEYKKHAHHLLSGGQKQRVAIAGILALPPKCIIFDEPTAVLTPQEITALFDILKKMKQQGCSIIIITHKMAEVMDISDRVTVLRKGESIATVVTKETTPKQLTEMMVGSAVSLEIERPKAEISEKPLLSVTNLTKRDYEGVNVLNNVSFDLYGGEILGVAGIAGSGQKELCEIIAGLDKANGGDITFGGDSILGLSPRAILKKGISMSFVPEDRLGMGLVAGMSVTNNVILKSYNRNRGPFLDKKFAKSLAEQIVDEFDISTPSVNHEVKKLSGGNIQKVLLGREIWLAPKVLITAYPVRGLDIGASYNIYRVLNEQKKKGVAVLFIGEDLDVLKSISDRLMVIHSGEIIDIVDPAEVTKEDIGLMMLGHHREEGAE